MEELKLVCKNIPHALSKFRREKEITIQQLSIRSGMSPANITRILNGDSELSILSLVRIVLALGEQEAADRIFYESMMDLIHPANFGQGQDTFSAADFAAWVILLSDYFDCENRNGASDLLNRIYYVLLYESVLWEAKKGAPRHFEDILNRYSEDPGLDYLLRSFYDRTTLSIILNNSEGTALTPIDSHFDHILRAGGIVSWADIACLVGHVMKRNEQSRSHLKNSTVIRRLQDQANTAYKHEDILQTDGELRLDGILYAMCWHAAKASLIQQKAAANLLEPANEAAQKTETGIASFFSFYRMLELRRSETAAEFLSGFRRQVCQSSYHFNLLKQFAAVNPEIFPNEPLRFYITGE